MVRIAFAIILALIFATPGIRLLGLRLRGNSGPEGWLSAFFLGLAVGIPVRLQLVGNPDVSETVLRTLSGVALTGLLTAACSLTIFTWLVFRRESQIAMLWTGLTACVFAGTGIGLFALDQMHNLMHPISMFANFWAITAFGWAFVECVQYYLKMRRQSKLGLGDPVVQNRFLLWSIWTGSCVLLPICVTFIKVSLLMNAEPGVPVAASDSVMLFMRFMILICGSSMLGAIGLSFFAPEAYLARIRGTQNA